MMNIPDPQLLELDDSWSPWKFQVNTFGDACHYGHLEHRIIRTGMSNFESREAAAKMLERLTQLHRRVL